MKKHIPNGREGLKRGQSRRDSGIVMIAAVLLMSGLIFIAGTSAIRSTGHTKVTSVEMDNTRTFYAAEGAVEWGASELKELLYNNLDPAQSVLDALPTPPLEGYNLTSYQVTKVGTMTSGLITQGDYAGLQGYVQRYAVQARVSSERRSTEIQREIEHQFIPLFQFGVFYDEDLEIFPGPPMTFLGAVHTNADLYMGSENSINCESRVTVVGQYWHHRKDRTMPDPPGNVWVKNQLGVDRDVWRGSYWLDNRQANWGAESLALWGGMFRDQAHGLATLKLPLPPASDQHVVVERADPSDGPAELDAKFWYKASIRYVDGALTDSLGNPLVQPDVYTYANNKFWDDREDRWVDVVDIDIQEMIDGGYAPASGVIYISHSSGDFPAVRVINGQTLPVGGLTIATDLPLYVKGNYNTVGKKGAALLCDAITLLSPNWNDWISNQPLSSRTPSSMSMNACIMTGHVATPTLGGAYSGGLENLFRFLENWSGRTVTFRGSIIDLWFSQQATAPWSYGSFYTAPNRNWGFDTDLLSPANWPPGTPRVHTIQRGTWRQIS